MKYLRITKLLGKLWTFALITSFFIITGAQLQANDSPIKTAKDLAYVLNSLKARNILPVSLRSNLPKSECRQYGAVSFTSTYDDFHLSIKAGDELETLKAAINAAKGTSKFASKAFTTMHYECTKKAHCYTLHFKTSDKPSKFTFILNPIKHDRAHFEKLNARYKQSSLWPIGASAAWARNPADNGQALNGYNITAGIADYGIRKAHKFGPRYLGGYDYISNSVLGIGMEQDKEKDISQVWENDIATHGDGVANVFAGPAGLAFGSNIYAIRIQGKRFIIQKRSGKKFVDIADKYVADYEVNLPAKSFGFESDLTIKAFIDGNKKEYRFRSVDYNDIDNFYPDAAQRLIDNNAKVVNLSVGTVGSAWYLNNPIKNLRNQQTGFNPIAQFIATLTDAGIAVVAIAGNAMMQQGPNDPGALACDHIGFNNRLLCVGAYTDKPIKEQNYYKAGKKCNNQEYLGKSNWAGPLEAMQQRFIVVPSKNGATSGCAPLVSAAYAVLFQLDPSLTAEEATEIICSTARAVGDAKRYGCGLLDLDAATRYLINKLRNDPEYHPAVVPEIDPTVVPEIDPTVVPEIDPTVAPEADPIVAPEAKTLKSEKQTETTLLSPVKVSLSTQESTKLLCVLDRLFNNPETNLQRIFQAKGKNYILQTYADTKTFQPFHEAIIKHTSKSGQPLSKAILLQAATRALQAGDIIIKPHPKKCFDLRLKDNKQARFICSLANNSAKPKKLGPAKLVGYYNGLRYNFTLDKRIGDGACGFRSFDMCLKRAKAPYGDQSSRKTFINVIKKNLKNPEVVRLCAPDVRRYKDLANDAIITAKDVRLYLDYFYIRQDEWLRTPSNRIPGTLDINEAETGCPDALALIRNFNYIIWQSDNAGGIVPNHFNLNQNTTRHPTLHVLNNGAGMGGVHYDCLHLDRVIEIPHENPGIYMPTATKDERTQTASNLLEGLLHSLNLNENVAVKVNNLTYNLSTQDYDNALHEHPEIEALKLDNEATRKRLIEQGIIRLHQEEESPGSILLRFEFLMGEKTINQSFRIKDCNPKFGIVDRDQAYKQLAEFVLCILGKENLFEAKDIDLSVVNRYQLAHEGTVDECPVFESSEIILPYLLSGDIRIEETTENPMDDFATLRLTVNIGGPIFTHQFTCQRLKPQDMSFAGLSTVKNRKAIEDLVRAVFLKKTGITIGKTKYAIAHDDTPESQEFFENVLVQVIAEALNSDKPKKDSINLAKCIQNRQIRVESFAIEDNTTLCTLYLRYAGFNTSYTFNLTKALK